MNYFKKVYEKVQGLNGILLVLYCFVILMPVIYDIMMYNQWATWKIGFGFAIGIALILMFACPYVLNKLNTSVFWGGGEEQSAEKSILFGILCGGLVFGSLLIWFWAYYPGFFFSDLKDQLDQAVSGNYSDWHPAIQTILTFTIPLKITKGWVGSIILFQMLLFSTVIGYAAGVLRKYTDKKYALISVLFIIFNPITGEMCLYPLKDTTFAIWGMLLMVFALQIYFTKGRWLDSALKMIVFSVVFSITTLVRHNGILFTAPLLLAVMVFSIERKRKIQIFILIVCLLSCVKGPLYSVLEVEKPGQRQSESLGLPLTVIGNVVVEHPEVLDEETKQFVYAINSQENWEKYYDRGSFNTIKWSEGTDLSVIDETGAGSVLKMMFRCIRKAPISSAEAFLALTKMVYALDESSRFYELGIEMEQYEVPYAGNTRIASWLEAYEDFIYGSVLKYVFCYIGMMHLIMLVCILGKSSLNSKDDWKRILFCIPVFAYDFGTMLLLTGRDDRFFYISFVVCPIVMAILLKEKSEKT